MSSEIKTAFSFETPPWPSIPPLQNGDHLSRAEFEQRWETMPNLKKAELLNGVVYMGAASLRQDQHGRPHAFLIWWLTTYAMQTPDIDVGDNASIRLGKDSMPQPDVFLAIPEAQGGQSRLTADGYIEGAPELVVEVSASSVSIDLHDKLEVYRRYGVQEYLVWRVLDRAVDWFALRDGAFVPLPISQSGIINSEIFPGLWLDTQALLQSNLRGLNEVLQSGLQSESHQAFVERLAERGRHNS